MPIALASHLSVERVDNSIIHALSPESMLEIWLGAHPNIANALRYDGKNYYAAWSTWPKKLKEDLAARWKDMVDWYGSGMPHPAPSSFPDPIPVSPAGDTNYGDFVMSAAHGRHVYLSHIANTLALEMTGKLPWSIAGYSQDDAKTLLSSWLWFQYVEPPNVTVEGYYFSEVHSPMTPAHVMRFLTSNDLLGTSALDTVARLFGWCRSLIHYFTNTAGTEPDIHAFWGPDVFPIPASMLVKGTNYTGYDPPRFGHYTYGCAGTAGFMRTILRAVNIPVAIAVPPCGHTMAQFPTIDRAMSHGDDPYNSLWRVTEFPGWPAPSPEECLITLEQYADWFGPSIDPYVSINNVGRRPAELAVQYVSDYLLDRYCDDTAAGLDHAGGKVYDTLKTYYSVAQLEALHLWDNLAAKATATNWCGSTSGAQAPPPAPPKMRRVEPHLSSNKHVHAKPKR